MDKKGIVAVALSRDAIVVASNTETEGREGLQFKKQKLSDSVAATTANAGANTGDDGGGVDEASSTLC